MVNAEDMSECRLIAESEDVPEDKRQLILPHGTPVTLGRTIFTGITDPQLSRKQAIFTADCINKNVKIIVTGPNSCGLDGFKVDTNANFIAKNGEIVELLHGTHRYRVEFNSALTSNLKPESSKSKCSFTDGNVSKKIKTSHDSTISKKPKPASEETMKMYDDHTLYVYTSKGVTSSKKIAAFDLDGTLIKPKSRKKFPIDKDDWQIIFNNVPGKLKAHIQEGYKVVIFTNQKSTPKKPFNADDFQFKLNNISKRIGVPIQVFIATSDNKYRKPVTGMWNSLQRMNDDIQIEKSASFYCGDAAGRDGDHSFADLLFAENLNLKFHTPENHFNGIPEKSFRRPKFDPKTLPRDIKQEDLLRSEIEIVVMVGYQGSGKSTLTKKIMTVSKSKYGCITQDELKTLTRCLSVAENFLKSSKSVIVDNTNLDVGTRHKWTQLARKFRVRCRCIWLDVSLEHCQHNNHFRQLTDNHHTKINNMIYNISKKKFEQPSKNEDFDEICKFQFVPEFEDMKKKELYFQHLLG